MRVKFGPWLPDQPDLDSGALEECVNCMPVGSGYYDSVRTHSVLAGSATVTSTATLVSMQPLLVAEQTGGRVYLAVGDPARIHAYGYSASASIRRTDLSRTASYATAATQWVFTRFGDSIIAGSIGDTMQVSTSGGAFRDMSASASAPFVSRLATVRDFVFAADAVATDATIRWCQINNPERWTVSARNQSDFQVLPDVTVIQGITGGDFATIIGDNAVIRATYVGSPLIFRFDTVATNVRCYSPYTIARYENMTFFVATDGVVAFDGASLHRIGLGRVDGYIQDNYPDRSHWLGVIDPHNRLYVLGAKSSLGGLVEALFIYGIETGNWSLVTGLSNVQHIMGSAQGAGAGALNSLTLERLQGLLSGQLGIGALVRLTAPLYAYSEFGANTYMTATFATGEAQPFTDHRAFVRGVRPLIQGDSNTSVSVEIGRRNQLTESVSYTSAVNVNANGLAPVRADARYLRARVKVTGGFQRAIGFDIDAVRSGKR